MTLPDSTYRKALMRNLRTKPVWNPRNMNNVYSWINFDKAMNPFHGSLLILTVVIIMIQNSTHPINPHTIIE